MYVTVLVALVCGMLEFTVLNEEASTSRMFNASTVNIYMIIV